MGFYDPGGEGGWRSDVILLRQCPMRERSAELDDLEALRARRGPALKIAPHPFLFGGSTGKNDRATRCFEAMSFVIFGPAFSIQTAGSRMRNASASRSIATSDAHRLHSFGSN